MKEDKCDASRFIYSLNSNDIFSPNTGLIIKDIVALQKEIRCDSWSFTSRNRDKVAYTLASFATTTPAALSWVDYIPQSHQLLMTNYLH